MLRKMSKFRGTDVLLVLRGLKAVSRAATNITEAELKEITKCANDIVYFAEKYAVVMTDNGIQQVKLREYHQKPNGPPFCF